MLRRPKPLQIAAGCIALGGLFGCEGRLDAGLASPRREAARCESPSAYTPLHRLTPFEYDAVAREVLGVTGMPASGFSVDDVGGFQHATQMNDAVLGQLEAAAEASAQGADLARIVPCDLHAGDAECARAFIAHTGMRLFRRPLSESEIGELTALYDASREGGSRPFEEGVREVIQAMLMSPDFLYHSTTNPSDAPGASTSIEGFELAARLSFFLWKGPPDEALLQAAQRGELHTADQVEMQARRMLEDPRAERGILRFFTEWLDFDRLAGISRVGVEGYEPALNRDLQRSLEAFIHYVAIEVGTLDALYTSNVIFVNERLARLYGIEGVVGDAMVAVEMPDAERHGLLTQPALMTLFSRTDHTDPIHRGLFVLSNVLCEEIGRPTRPVPELPRVEGHQSNRERFALHTSNAECQSCHARIDPVGFTFEHYDPLGRFLHIESNGASIDATATIVLPAEIAGHVEDARELAERIAHAPRARSCMAEHVMTYALQRPLTEADRCASAALGRTLTRTGGDFRELMISIALSDAFRTRPVQSR